MTRFARALGSKASNEKKPEEATTWLEMKGAMLVKPEKTSTVQTKATKAKPGESKWASLSDVGQKKKLKKGKEDLKGKAKKRSLQSEDVSSPSTKKMKKGNVKVEDVNLNPVVKIKNGDNVDLNLTKSQMKKLKQQGRSKMNDNEKVRYDKFKDRKAQKKNAEPIIKTPKLRRKPGLESHNIFVNGEEVAIAPFDGYYVTADEAERLQELRNKLKREKVSRSEVVKIIKLERRRAEKALAKLKKKVCFNCRKSGHNLSDCPEVGEVKEKVSGMCYKCGSMEHTHFECKVVHGQEFRFADCFICKEQGHIAKQCPDNPRGMYPKGGACSACGDVTHLKKDCPKYGNEKEVKNVFVGTVNNGNALEGLEEDKTVQKTGFVKAKRAKHVQF